MTNIGIDPELIGAAALLLLLLAVAFWGWRAYQRRARRKALLARLERVHTEMDTTALVSPQKNTSGVCPPDDVSPTSRTKRANKAAKS